MRSQQRSTAFGARSAGRLEPWSFGLSLSRRRRLETKNERFLGETMSNGSMRRLVAARSASRSGPRGIGADRRQGRRAADHHRLRPIRRSRQVTLDARRRRRQAGRDGGQLLSDSPSAGTAAVGHRVTDAIAKLRTVSPAGRLAALAPVEDAGGGTREAGVKPSDIKYWRFRIPIPTMSAMSSCFRRRCCWCRRRNMTGRRRSARARRSTRSPSSKAITMSSATAA